MQKPKSLAWQKSSCNGSSTSRRRLGKKSEAKSSESLMPGYLAEYLVTVQSKTRNCDPCGHAVHFHVRQNFPTLYAMARSCHLLVSELMIIDFDKFFCMGLSWLRRPHEFGSPSGGHQKRFQQEASESSAMVALLLLRCWLCMLLSGVYGSHFSTRAELREALLQRLGGCDPVLLANSFTSMTSQSIRLMPRQQMFGGRKRPIA